MSNNVAFDTLEYATILKRGGVENVDIHSASLAKAITQNFYVKGEVDKMIEATLKEFRNHTLEMRKESEERILEMRREAEERAYQAKLEMQDIRNQMDKTANEAYNRVVTRLTINIGIISALLAIITTIAHYIH